MKLPVAFNFYSLASILLELELLFFWRRSPAYLYISTLMSLDFLGGVRSPSSSYVISSSSKSNKAPERKHEKNFSLSNKPATSRKQHREMKESKIETCGDCSTFAYIEDGKSLTDFQRSAHALMRAISICATHSNEAEEDDENY